MKLLPATTAALFLLLSASVHAEPVPAPARDGAPALEIMRKGSLSVSQGAAQYFTGSVRIDTLFKVHEPSRTTVGRVSFEPGARTAWHVHPYGQILIVTEGKGLIQKWGAPIEEIRQGDVVWIPPGLKHWHGAAPKESMTHFAIQEQIDGKAVDWMEKVNDEQYQPGTGAQ